MKTRLHVNNIINQYSNKVFYCTIMYYCLHILVSPVLSFASCADPFRKITISQLFQGIRNQKEHSFRDFYAIGENSFNAIKDEPVFIKQESQTRILNPYYYDRLVAMLSPIFQSNKKGFIVTSDIPEANRLTDFLNKMIKGIPFEAYHSEIPGEQRIDVLNNSKEMDSHYIVVVRRVNRIMKLSKLSSYIDLNVNAALDDIMYRIKKILHLSPVERGYDVLFTVDSTHEKKTKGLLNLLEVMDVQKIDATLRYFPTVNRNFMFNNGGIIPLKRGELSKLREKLKKSISNLWETKQNKDKGKDNQKEQKSRKKKWLTYSEARDLIRSKGIRTRNEFRGKRKYDQELQQIPYHPEREYKDHWIGWPVFSGTYSRRSFFDVLRDQEKERQTELPYFMETQFNENGL